MSERVKKQATKMLASRGYEIKDHKAQWIVGTKTDESGKKEKVIAEYIESEGSIGVAVIRDIVKMMKKEKATKGILIAEVPFTSYAKKEAKKNKIDIFTADRLKISLLDHDLIPRHEILSKEETEEVLNGYNITSAQLPKIKIIDPVCELIGAKLGQILRITRNSQTADVAVYYRLVVA